MAKKSRRTKSDVTLGLVLTALIVLVIYKRAGMGSKITNAVQPDQPQA